MEERKAFYPILFSQCAYFQTVLNESVASVCYALSRVVVLLSPKYIHVHRSSRLLILLSRFTFID